MIHLTILLALLIAWILTIIWFTYRVPGVNIRPITNFEFNRKAKVAIIQAKNERARLVRNMRG